MPTRAERIKLPSFSQGVILGQQLLEIRTRIGRNRADLARHLGWSEWRWYKLEKHGLGYLPGYVQPYLVRMADLDPQAIAVLDIQSRISYFVQRQLLGLGSFNRREQLEISVDNFMRQRNLQWSDYTRPALTESELIAKLIGGTEHLNLTHPSKKSID